MTNVYMPHGGAEIKSFKVSTNRWIAMRVDVLDHEVVGAHVKAPKPTDPSKPAWQPFVLWFWLLTEAAPRERKRLIKGQMIMLQRGQIAVSYRYLAKKANWGVKAVRVFLERLQTFEMVTLSSAAHKDQLTLALPDLDCHGPEKGTPITVVSICNYDRYQHDFSEKGTAGAQQGHSRGTAGAQILTRDTVNTRDNLSEGSRKKEDLGSSGTDAALGERLPFSPDVLHELAQTDGVNLPKLVRRYFTRTASKRIDDPSAYLHTMGMAEGAKHAGVTVDQFKKLCSKDQTQRAAAMANVVGAFSRPSDACWKRHTRAGQSRAEQALAYLAGKSYTSQASADLAFEGAIMTVRFSDGRKP